MSKHDNFQCHHSKIFDPDSFFYHLSHSPCLLILDIKGKE